MSGNDSGLTHGEQLSFEQGSYKDVVNHNEANIESSFLASTVNDEGNSFEAYPKTINEGKQGKHIIGHNNYEAGKSILTVSLDEAQRLLLSFSGTGSKVGNHKERVDFNRIIGLYSDPVTGNMLPTSVGIIHYSNTGAHIVPARPKEN